MTSPRIRFGLALGAALVIAACSQGADKKKSAKDDKEDDKTESSSKPKKSGKADASKLTFTRVKGKEIEHHAVVTVDNQLKSDVHWAYVAVYAYDEKGKQLNWSDGEPLHKAGFTFEPNIGAGKSSEEHSANYGAGEEPEGTKTIQIVTLQIDDAKGASLYKIEPAAQRAKE